VITLEVGGRYFRCGVSFRIRINYMSRYDIDDYMIDREMMHMHDINIMQICIVKYYMCIFDFNVFLGRTGSCRITVFFMESTAWSLFLYKLL
jgi:hypothetical protein